MDIILSNKQNAFEAVMKTSNCPLNDSHPFI